MLESSGQTVTIYLKLTLINLLFTKLDFYIRSQYHTCVQRISKEESKKYAININKKAREAQLVAGQLAVQEI